LCTAAGAAELLRESMQQTRDALTLASDAIDTNKKLKGKLTSWLIKSAAVQPATAS